MYLIIEKYGMITRYHYHLLPTCIAITNLSRNRWAIVYRIRLSSLRHLGPSSFYHFAFFFTGFFYLDCMHFDYRYGISNYGTSNHLDRLISIVK